MTYFFSVRPKYIPSIWPRRVTTVFIVLLLVDLPTDDTILVMNSASLSALNDSCRLLMPSLQLTLKLVYLFSLLEDVNLLMVLPARLMVRSLPSTLHWNGMFFVP